MRESLQGCHVDLDEVREWLNRTLELINRQLFDINQSRGKDINYDLDTQTEREDSVHQLCYYKQRLSEIEDKIHMSNPFKSRSPKHLRFRDAQTLEVERDAMLVPHSARSKFATVESEPVVSSFKRSTTSGSPYSNLRLKQAQFNNSYTH